MQWEIQPDFVYKQIKEYTAYSSDLSLLTPKVEAGCFAEMLVFINAICQMSAQKIVIWTLMAVKTRKTYIISSSCLSTTVYWWIPDISDTKDELKWDTDGCHYIPIMFSMSLLEYASVVFCLSQRIIQHHYAISHFAFQKT